MAIKERKQITGTTAQIQAYAGHEGQIVWNKEKKTFVGMSGTAGENYPLASQEYVDTTNAQLTEGLAGKADESHTHTIDDVTGLQDALNGKLGATAKAQSAQVADSANSVDWDNVKNRPSIPSSPDTYVTSTWSSGANWYRKWSDGFIEQGGQETGVSEENYAIISFNTPFRNIPTVVVSRTRSSTCGYVAGIRQDSVTSTSFLMSVDEFNPNGYGNKQIIFWSAFGY